MTTMINGFFPGNLKPNTIVAGCINIYESVWPEPNNTIEQIEKDCSDPNTSTAWLKAETIGDGVNQNARTNLNMCVTDLALRQDNVLMQNIHNQFNMTLLAATIPYANQYSIIGNLSHEPYSLLKYSGGQEYKAHHDGTGNTPRCISALVYLNDNYEGGELEFVNFGIKIKPEAGMLVLFPSNFAYTHIAHPVTSGTKYALVTWIRDL